MIGNTTFLLQQTFITDSITTSHNELLTTKSPITNGCDCRQQEYIIFFFLSRIIFVSLCVLIIKVLLGINFLSLLCHFCEVMPPPSFFLPVSLRQIISTQDNNLRVSQLLHSSNFPRKSISVGHSQSSQTYLCILFSHVVIQVTPCVSHSNHFPSLSYRSKFSRVNSFFSVLEVIPGISYINR